MKNIVDLFEDEIEPFLKNICVNENQLNAYVGCLGDVALKYFLGLLIEVDIEKNTEEYIKELRNIQKERS